ncbi:hypothetical protein BCL80_102212 [Streptomyces avidinii]|nr:hypothetical protein [Streptomyces pratensis]RAS34847.1 hypothetical protein BCL80_102212 [Streptomyces avidinii]SNX79151.1 hypothetical protein SAMN05421860_107442 [Streptomyces microflavus]
MIENDHTVRVARTDPGCPPHVPAGFSASRSGS